MEEIQRASKGNGFVMMVRNNEKCREFMDTIIPTLDSSEICFLYSQFMGYILPKHSAFQQRTYDFVHSHNWNLEYLHTSGHASREALEEVCKKVNPRLAIIPIHRDAESDFRSLDIPQELRDRVVTKSTSIEDVEIVIK